MEQEQTGIEPEATAIAEPEVRSESLSDTIDRAFKTVEDRARTPEGKFAKAEPEAAQEPPPEAPKADVVKFEPPARFSADAKAAWVSAPEPVKAEINRALKELEGGIQKYQERWAPLSEYDALARQHGTTLDKALANYVGIERQLAQDPIKGLTIICDNLGVSFRDIAAQVLNVPANDNQTISELRREIAELRQTVGGVTSTIQSETEQRALREIAEFKKDRPRFDELSDDIAFFIQAGRAKGLDDAYQLAERLNPAPPAPTAQPKKANLSLTGGPGSSPVRKPSASNRDNLDTIFDQLGIS